MKPPPHPQNQVKSKSFIPSGFGSRGPPTKCPPPTPFRIPHEHAPRETSPAGRSGAAADGTPRACAPAPCRRRGRRRSGHLGVRARAARASALYVAMSLVAYRVIHMRHVAPLPTDAPREAFAEGRVLQHLRRLAVEIPGRQEGNPGLEAAAQYIKGELEGLAARAGPEYSIEVQETLVSGSFSMMFLRHRVTLGYRNHKNVVMRISSNVSEDDDPSLLVNGHFDSPLGSSGAADCGSCVGKQ
ncbi:hypothetical protein PR202_gb12859 [Eleusine coracana subsp. coracana]|uniref:Uncharacterized protein n=1 Tax=Eleusine coracana subsp. coracana TaxID=191504 RepID=A0AAV5ES49_ELECO|nr:hypothetical protein PR202_gb12859 [Eleusine coracana subsp. coracana]